jgi:hypothetical protein
LNLPLNTRGDSPDELLRPALLQAYPKNFAPAIFQPVIPGMILPAKRRKSVPIETEQQSSAVIIQTSPELKRYSLSHRAGILIRRHIP